MVHAARAVVSPLTLASPSHVTHNTYTNSHKIPAHYLPRDKMVTQFGLSETRRACPRARLPPESFLTARAPCNIKRGGGERVLTE